LKKSISVMFVLLGLLSASQANKYKMQVASNAVRSTNYFTELKSTSTLSPIVFAPKNGILTPYWGTNAIDPDTMALIMENQPNKEIASLFKNGKRKVLSGSLVLGIGSGLLGGSLGGAVSSLMLTGSISTESQVLMTSLSLGGVVTIFIGSLIISSGSRSLNRSIELFNEKRPLSFSVDLKNDGALVNLNLKF